MSLLLEAGIFSWVATALFFVSLAVAVSKKSDALRVATPLAGVLGALGLLGAGVGQRLVDGAVQSVTSLDERLLILSAGTREASANLVVTGLMMLLLLAISAGVSASRR